MRLPVPLVLVLATGCLSVTKPGPKDADTGLAIDSGGEGQAEIPGADPAEPPDDPGLPPLDPGSFPDTSFLDPGYFDPGPEPGSAPDLSLLESGHWDPGPEPGSLCPPIVDSFVVDSTHVPVGATATLKWTLMPGAEGATVGVEVEPGWVKGFLVPSGAASMQFRYPPDGVTQTFRTLTVTFSLKADYGVCTDTQQQTLKVLGTVWTTRYTNEVRVFRSDGHPLSGGVQNSYLGTPWAIRELSGERVAIGNKDVNLSAQQQPVVIFGTDGIRLGGIGDPDDISHWDTNGCRSVMQHQPSGDLWLGGPAGKILVYADSGANPTFKKEIDLPTDYPTDKRHAEDLFQLATGEVVVVYGQNGPPWELSVDVLDGDGKYLHHLEPVGVPVKLGVWTAAPGAGNEVLLGGTAGNQGHLVHTKASGAVIQYGGPYPDNPKYGMTAFGDGWLVILTGNSDISQKIVRFNAKLEADNGDPFGPEDYNAYRSILVLGGN